jgi:Leucine-rich repeat (LRR) protein
LSYNKISSIHDGAFDKIGVNITQIDLSFNLISIYKEELLWPMFESIDTKWLNARLFINLEHNEITEWEASDKNRTTTTISNLNLSDNKLKSFKLKNIKLNKLLLANNEIEDFDANFNSIDISNNKIKDLRINSACTSILATHNEISEIFFTPGLSSISVKFDVSYNNLKSSQNFHEFLKNQKKISSLDLSHNFFGTFALEDFADMENLEDLSLSNTGISELPFGLFAHLQNLKSLNLSQNNLKEIDFHVFSSLGNLTILDISGNSLSHIEEHEKLKEVLPNLKSIGLEGL